MGDFTGTSVDQLSLPDPGFVIASVPGKAGPASSPNNQFAERALVRMQSSAAFEGSDLTPGGTASTTIQQDHQ